MPGAAGDREPRAGRNQLTRTRTRFPVAARRWPPCRRRATRGQAAETPKAIRSRPDVGSGSAKDPSGHRDTGRYRRTTQPRMDGTAQEMPVGRAAIPLPTESAPAGVDGRSPRRRASAAPGRRATQKTSRETVSGARPNRCPGRRARPRPWRTMSAGSRWRARQPPDAPAAGRSEGTRSPNARSGQMTQRRESRHPPNATRS